MAFNEIVCAFCMSDVHQNATVCPHCGAYKGVIMNTWNNFPVWVTVIGISATMLGYSILSSGPSSKEGTGLVIFLVGIGMLLWLFQKVRKKGLKRTWLRRG